MTLNTSSPRYQALLQLLRTSDTIWNASRDFFSRWDLSPSQFNVLNLLSGTAGVSQTDLSRQLIVHRSNITGLVDRLEKRGLVKRNEVTGDRRSYHITLTAEGGRLMAEVLPEYYAGAERLWGGLSAARLMQLTEDLRCAASNSEKIARDVKPKPKKYHEHSISG